MSLKQAAISFKACASVAYNLLDFYMWKVEPSNSLTKRTASFRQIGRRIQYVDVFKFPQNRESFTGMQSLSFYHGVLRCNIFEINSGMLTSFKDKS